MGSDNNQDSKYSLIPILLLIMLTTGTLIPLTSSRPNEPQHSKILSTDDHKADARLWQDPIVAVERNVNQLKSIQSTADFDAKIERDSMDKFRDKIKEELGGSVDGALKIIAISVFGSSYSESVEFRQRYRYSVVSALGARGYSAQDTEHIKFTRLKPDESSDNSEIYVPYEWFESHSKSQPEQKEKALILWLNEDKIIPAAYGKFISILFNKLREIHSYNFSFTLIGPTNTPSLVGLMDLNAIRDTYSPSFKIISSSATISDSDLFDVIEKEGRCDPKDVEKERECIQEAIAEKLAKKSIVRTIGQDEDLAKALLWELGQRGVNRETLFKNKCEDELILISEQHSLYAKKLTEHFSKLLDQQCPGKALITNFTYLRGLDGKLPDFDDSSKQSPNENNRKEQKNLITQLDDAPPEHADGRNQFDYLRRITETIEQLERNQGFGTNRIKAIGIIGNDVYDKLLILQALRDRFKNRIFFTTELDARYLHADQSKWTRNLVVASNFDLMLHPRVQNPTMPFRDSYQTSMYLATLFALQTDLEIPSQKPLKPQIFEIGRTGAIHLASLDVGFLNDWIKNTETQLTSYTSASSECTQDSLFSCVERNRQEDKEKNLEIWILGCTFIFVGFISLSFVFYQPIQEAFFKPDERARNITFMVIFFVLLLLIILGIFEDNAPFKNNGEPFFWMEGVSTWPNLVIRFFGLVIILFVFLYFLKKKSGEAKKIETEFCLSEYQSDKYVEKTYLSQILQGPALEAADLVTLNVNTLWLKYRGIADLSKSRIHLWLIGAAIIPLGLTLTLFYFGYLNFPTRGEITRNLHYIFSTLQFLFLWFLIFWVGYEVNACRNFINCLNSADDNNTKNQSNEEPIAWPPSLLHKKSKETRIAKAELEPYVRFLLITRVTERINSLIYIPFILMFLIIVGRSNIFDNLGLSPALIIVFLSALTYLTMATSLLRISAEKQCNEILNFYDSYRSEWSDLLYNNKNDIDLLRADIRSKKQSIFASFFHRPTVIAALLPGGGIGLAQIIEYLYN